VSKYKKSADTKQKILETTVSLVLENGYANLNIKDIADRLEMPRSLIYYYYKNRDDIMTELYYGTYGKLSDLAVRLVKDRDDPILHLIAKYILHYRFVIQNAVLRDFFFSRPAYVYQGREAVRTAADTCFAASRKAFQRLRPDASENDLYMAFKRSAVRSRLSPPRKPCNRNGYEVFLFLLKKRVLNSC